MYEDDYIDTADMWRIEQEAREADRLLSGYYCTHPECYEEEDYDEEEEAEQ